MIDGSCLLFVSKNEMPQPHLGVMHLQGEWRECLEATMRASHMWALHGGSWNLPTLHMHSDSNLKELSGTTIEEYVEWWKDYARL
jgi:hypothetical protein